MIILSYIRDGKFPSILDISSTGKNSASQAYWNINLLECVDFLGRNALASDQILQGKIEIGKKLG